MSEATAVVIADSISPLGVRITTLELSYWRAIHSEFMTHRMFSRNASSSRAIPVRKVLAQVEENPVEPLYWGTDKPGMQAGAELEPAEILRAQEIWREAAATSARFATMLMELGVHKQISNRLLEPFINIKVVVTSTEWNNFFALRDHPAAMPEIQDLARKIKKAMDASDPVPLAFGEWHLPYIPREFLALPKPNLLFKDIIKISVARCARVSYLTHDRKITTLEEDTALYEKLVCASPPHMSPAEHQAQLVFTSF
jgi:Thymidylate synthase complementing protein